MLCPDVRSRHGASMLCPDVRGRHGASVFTAGFLSSLFTGLQQSDSQLIRASGLWLPSVHTYQRRLVCGDKILYSENQKHQMNVNTHKSQSDQRAGRWTQVSDQHLLVLSAQNLIFTLTLDSLIRNAQRLESVKLPQVWWLTGSSRRDMSSSLMSSRSH